MIVNDEVQISVIMPVYNAGKYLEQAVESVKSQKVRWELLVIDDCSTDESTQILKEYRDDERIRVIWNATNQGVAESRNKGIRMARGKYIAFLDADDWWETNKLAIQYELLENEHAILCCTGRELMKEDGSSTGKVIQVPDYITYHMLLKTNYIPCSSVVIRTDIAREFYMEHAELHEDYILWLRVLDKYGAARGINRPLLKSRMSAGGKSRNKWKSANMQWRVYRFIGVGRIKALWYMLNYTINGIRKYF